MTALLCHLNDDGPFGVQQIFLSGGFRPCSTSCDRRFEESRIGNCVLPKPSASDYDGKEAYFSSGDVLAT